MTGPEGDSAGAMRHILSRRPFGAIPPQQREHLNALIRDYPALDGRVHCVDRVWRAEIPVDDGERVVARHDLGELLRLVRSILPAPDSG